MFIPGRVAQSVGHPTRKSGVLGSIPGLATYFRFSLFFFFSRRAVVSYWRKYVHEVLVNRLGGLSLPRKSVVRLTDRPDMTLDVYRGRKTTKQQLHVHKSKRVGGAFAKLPKVAKPKVFFFNKAEISNFYTSHKLIEYHCFILTIHLQKLKFLIFDGTGIARLPGV